MFLWKYRAYALSILAGLIVLGLFARAASSAPLDWAGSLWAPFVEWSFQNSTYSGNPFDLIASATFVHSGTGEKRKTQLFYNGSDTWKLRFTGTRIGTWTFTTESNDPDLNGKSGTVTIYENPNSAVRGFLTAAGNKYARQRTSPDDLEGFLFNIYYNYPVYHSRERLGDFENQSHIDGYLGDARNNGFETIFIDVAHNWFKLGAQSYNDHSNVNPDLKTFSILEKVVISAHKQGMTVHFWAWGDQQRKWTPIGLSGGINGTVDRRLQRYIAARLGPLPGWTMSYGFDLQEWVSEEQVGSWAKFMHEHMGWRHLLSARGRFHPELDIASHSGLKHPYTDAVNNLSSVTKRPQLFEERDIYTRDGISMDFTRQHLWRYALAGGHGGFWGRYWANGGPPYPNPEQIRTFRQFWKNRFVTTLSVVNGVTNGLALKTADSRSFVFYKENTASIQLNLSNMSGSQVAIAVDAKKPYAEMKLGSLSATNQTWTAPYSSDWVVAVGNFGQGTSVPPGPSMPEAPTALKISPH